jgi:hypothetical protein
MISLSQGLCLHRTAQHRKTRTDNYALSGISTNNSSIQAAKTNALDHADTEIERINMINNELERIWEEMAILTFAWRH